MIPLAGSVALAVFGMGSACPGTDSTGAFQAPGLAVPAKASFTKSWQTPVYIDFGAVTDTSTNALRKYGSNQVGGGAGTVSFYPMALASDQSGSFYAASDISSFLNYYGTGGANQIANGVVIANPSITSFSNWVQGYGSFTQIDSIFNPLWSGQSGESIHPIAAVDTQGNATVVMFTKETSISTAHQPIAMRHVFGSGVWDTATTIGSSAEAAGGFNALVSGAIAADAYNDTVAVWVQHSKAYFNEYRPGMGWRFQSGGAFSTWHNAGSIEDVGVDIAFDSYGNGYGAYVTTTPSLMLARWRGDSTVGFNTANAADYLTLDPALASASDGFPRIFIKQDGSAEVYYYKSYAANYAQLYKATVSAPFPSGSFPGVVGTTSRVDSGYGAGAGSSVYVTDGSSTMSPLLSVAGAYAALGFIKSDGTTNRLYVLQYANGSWSSLGTADTAGTGTGVSWASVAADATGDVAVAYSLKQAGGVENVYANYYGAAQGSWQGVTQLDSASTLISTTWGDTSSGYPRPAVAIDASGNAAAAFSKADYQAGLNPTSARRAVVSTYH